jgi:hypothetical protein
MPPSTTVRSTSLALMVVLAGCLGAGKGQGEGKGGADDGPAPDDTAAVDCTAAPLDCDGRDNDCDGVIDERGERDGRRPGTEDDPCPENCRAVGDEDRDGLADCEDADCAPVCVEDCDDRRDNDMDGTLDCADVDCGVDLRCWSGLELRTPDTVRLERYQRWHYLFATESATRAVTLEAPTVTVVGRVVTGGGASTTCTLRAHEVSARWRWRSHDGPGSSSGTWVTSGAGAGLVDPPTAGCPEIDVHTLIAEQLRLSGDSGRWFRTVVLLDLGREWALDHFTIGIEDRRSGAYPYTWTSGPSSSVVTTSWVGGWMLSTATATADGFAPLP